VEKAVRRKYSRECEDFTYADRHKFSRECEDFTYAGHETPTFQGKSPVMSSRGAYYESSRVSGRTPKGSAKNGHWSSFVLRGLPFDVTENQVVSFIEQFAPAGILASMQAVTLVTNPQGKPSGFAEVQLDKRASFDEVRDKLHMQRLGDRYIEVLPPSSTKSKSSPWKALPYRNGGRWSGENSKPGRDSWRQM